MVKTVASFLLAVLLVCKAEGQAVTSCPSVDVDISPCTCEGDGVMQCTGLTSAAQLKAIFSQDFRGNDLMSVNISKSALGRIPEDVFGDKQIFELYFTATSFSVPFASSFQSTRTSLKKFQASGGSTIDILNLDSLEGGLVELSITDSDLKTFKGNPSLPQLKFIDINRCQIRNLPVLTKARLVERFRVTNTNLNSLAPNIFLNFPRLKVLDLESNELAGLSPGWLNLNSDVLSIVNLCWNSIAYVEPGAISGLRGSTSLNLSGNSMTTLNEDAFRPLLGASLFGNIVLGGNMFRCDCSMAWFFRDRPLVEVIQYGNCHLGYARPGSPYVPFINYGADRFTDC